MYITFIYKKKKKSNTNKYINIILSNYDKTGKYTKLEKKKMIKIKRYHRRYFQQVDNVRRNCGQFSSYRTGPNPFSLVRRQLPEEFIAGNGERKQDSPPRARLLFKGTQGGEGERVGKKNEE